jgi:hypothetical protein
VLIARILVIGTATTFAIGLAAAPAAAAPTDTTAVTFEVSAGTLDIVAPTAADLGSGAPGAALSAALGATTVTDSRASADASWEATTITSDFVTGDETPTETTLATEVDYWSGAATATTGSGTFLPGQADAGAAEALDDTTPLTTFTHTGGTGNNTATWNPTIVVNSPLDAQAGDYTGTVTHSVA